MGIANYFDSDPNFTAVQETELVRLTKALRQLIDHTVKLNAPLETLSQLADTAESMAATMQPYSGVRPKLGGPGSAAADFLVQGPAVHGIAGLVNLFGIESPGLTSCLAIGETVAALLQAA